MSEVARIREQAECQCETTLTIITPREIVPEAETVLVRHGCMIKPHNTHSEIVFPKGTAREEIRPRMPQSERYKLVLPDGYVVQETYVRHLEQSILYYSPDAETRSLDLSLNSYSTIEL